MPRAIAMFFVFFARTIDPYGLPYWDVNTNLVLWTWQPEKLHTASTASSPKTQNRKFVSRREKYIPIISFSQIWSTTSTTPPCRQARSVFSTSHLPHRTYWEGPSFAVLQYFLLLESAMSHVPFVLKTFPDNVLVLLEEPHLSIC
jgi:hypothetical protein